MSSQSRPEGCHGQRAERVGRANVSDRLLASRTADSRWSLAVAPYAVNPFVIIRIEGLVPVGFEQRKR